MRNIYRILKCLPLFEDRQSLAAFLRLVKACFWGSTKIGDDQLVALRLRSLPHQQIYCRPYTTDVSVLMYVFGERYHLPPAGPPIRSILDLGSNIGLTLANYAQLFPEARILGVELDSDNAVLCRCNIHPWSSRVDVIRGAVWSEDGSITYSGEGEDGYHISVTDGSADVKTARAYSMESIIQQLGVSQIDYVKMDIEGAEQVVLAEPGAWVDKIRCFNIEIHPPYTVDACIASLTRFNFHCKAHFRKCPGVIAMNQRYV